MTTRRTFLAGLTGFVACAPAIVRASSLMKVKALAEPMSAPIITHGLQVGDTFALELNRHSVADFLLPGIRNIMAQYQDIHGQWHSAFTVTAVSP